jgi:hypothetical protein
VSYPEAFIATCSPDELLGQVIQTLCPRYNIDAPHLLALRQLLSSTIVAPRSPPTLKRTRPDKRIGEIGSIYDTPRRSPFGPNGPPVSANQSFYFHHQDADFERLLPRADRSHYVRSAWRDEPESQSDSDGREVPDSQESSQSQVSRPEILATERKGMALSPSSVASASTARDERTAAKAHSQAQEPQAQQSLCSQGIHGSTSNDEKPSISDSDPATPRRTAPANSLVSQQPTIPTITITTPRSTERMFVNELENTVLQSSLPSANNVAIKLPDSQDVHSVSPPPYSASPFYMPRGSDTQDTVNSTQQSEVFSPPNDFVHFTPTSQEETQQESLSQAEMSDSYLYTTAVKPDVDHPKPPSRRSPRVTSTPPIATPSLSKRSREKAESSDAAPSLKRSKAKR